MAIIAHDNQKRDLVSGKTVFDYADDLKVQVPTSCGRAGICHECVVEISQGMEALSPRGEAESFLRDNYRLACQAWIENPDIDIHFSPLRRRPKILVETAQKNMDLAPLILVRARVSCTMESQSTGFVAICMASPSIWEPPPS
jgi:ferredoxin